MTSHNNKKILNKFVERQYSYWLGMRTTYMNCCAWRWKCCLRRIWKCVHTSKNGRGGDSHMVLVMWLKIIFKMAAPIGFLFVLCLQIVLVFSGMLYPRNSVSRTVFQKIDGMWNFRIDASESRFQGFSEKWYTRPLKQVQAIHCLRPLW